jgi:hypothetical protein
MDPLKKKLTDAELKGLFPGLKPKDLTIALREEARRGGLNATGTIINRADDAKESMLKLAKEYGLRNMDDLKEFIQGTGKVFESAYEKAAAAGHTPSSLLAPALAEGGELATFAAEHGDDGAKVVKDIIGRIDKAPDLRTAKAFLDKQVQFYRSPQAALMGQAAFDAPDLLYALKDRIDDAVMDLEPALAGAKKDWRALQPLRKMLAREETALGGLGIGSPTFEKSKAAKLVEGLSEGGGAGIGGVIAGIPGMLAGSAIGQGLSKGVPKVANFLTGALAGKLNTPEGLAALEKGIAGIRKVAGKAGQIGAAAASIAPRVAGAAPSILERAKEEAPILENQGAMKPGTPEEAQASAEASEAAVAPEQAEEAKQEVTSKWADQVTSGVQDAYYAYGLKDAGWSYEDFLGAVQEATDNFNPTLAAEIVFPDEKERTAFLKDYDRALQYKAINVSEALEPSAPFWSATDQKGSRAQLRDFMARIAGQDPMLMDPKKAKQIDAMITRVSKMKGSPADKQSALLRELQANYGVDFARLANLGLLGVA